ncbi:MAG TPA: VOC family protein [Candidatus Limnocylindria bacterium]|nr:VOC family protein [Candidatus Limnocylindria bacterium]
MTTQTTQLTASAFEKTDGLQDWRVISEGGCIYFRTASFADSARLVQVIAELPEIGDHPPAIDIRAGGVTVRTISVSADYMGMTTADVALAQRISALGRELGLTADPARIQALLVIPGAPDIKAVMPFWQAVLGYQPRIDSPAEDLVDPLDRGAPFWFETMQEPRSDRGGGDVHISVWVPHDQAEARVAAALAAGGHMVRDDYAPAWWTLADTAGNEVDVSTTAARD